MKKKTILSLILVALAALSANARNINISGRVTYEADNKAAAGVIVSTLDSSGNQVKLTMTDDDGNYVVTADDEGILIFSNDKVIKQVTVDVNEQFEINVQVKAAQNVLDEVVVKGNRGKKKSNILENAVLEVEGNWAKFKRYPITIPVWLNSEHRYIIQPAIYNSTRDTITYLKPRVIDCWRYATTQERMYDWNLSNDTLASGPHYTTKDLCKQNNNTIIIRDSLYLYNPDDELFSVVIQQVENYNKIVFLDSQQVAQGTTNPFRFLKINLKPLEMTETEYLYQDKPEPRDTKGEMNLMFDVGKSNLNIDLGDNSRELSALVSEINNITSNNDAKLREISIFGYSSPEGSYETNTKLANARMKSAIDFIKQSVDLKKSVKLNSEATVAPWEEVIKALRADSLNKEADQIQEILDSRTGHDSQFSAIARLPFYRPLLTDTYLPRLRRVNYTIKYDFQRVLTDDEIARQYQVDPSQLTRAQLYRYYSGFEGKEREEIIKQTLKTHPDHWIAATDLAKIMIERDENPYDILANQFPEGKLRPTSTRYNFGIAAMMSKKYNMADSIFNTIEDKPETHMAKLYCDLMNGYEVNTDEIAKDNPLNQVLILLKRNDNLIAYTLAKKLGNSAEEDYVKAIAANRVAVEDEDNYDAADDATMYLESAIRKKHKLYETALTDQDVVEVLEYIKNIDEILSAPEEKADAPLTKNSEQSEEVEEDLEADANSAEEGDNTLIQQ